ncbi:MAG: N-acetyltransferase [Pseudomonadota bacterium]
MLADVQIRPFQSDDLNNLEKLYKAAFPDENLLPLVRELAESSDVVCAWIAELAGSIVGHVAFTRCAVGAKEGVYLLGPLAVSPDYQRRGLGQRLIELGFAELRERRATLVCVLGDPAYYSRSGFGAEGFVQPPFKLPYEWDGAWQSTTLDERKDSLSGQLVVPPVWNKAALWQP